MLGSQDAYPAIDLDCDLAHTVSSSRRELALSPTCRAARWFPRRWDVADTAIKRDAPAFAKFVEEAQ
jgi:hypothetical protein